MCRSALVVWLLALAACGQSPDVVVDLSRSTPRVVSFRACPSNDGGPLDCTLKKDDAFAGHDQVSIALDSSLPLLRLYFTVKTSTVCLGLDVPSGRIARFPVRLDEGDGGLAFSYSCAPCTQVICQ